MMDPRECLKAIHEALRDGCRGEARDHARDLAKWVRRGGFSPDWSEYPEAVAFVRQFHPYVGREEAHA